MTNFYGIRKLFRRGIRLYLLPTFRCNLDCSYCSNDLLIGRRPVSTELYFDDWRKILSNFPLKIREIVITGGEPFLYRQIAELIDYCTNNYFVSVRTNGTFTCDLQRSSKLIINPTYHAPVDVEKFKRNISIFRQAGHLVIVTNPEGAAVETYRKTEIHNFDQAGEMCFDIPRLTLAPNGRLFYNFRTMFQWFGGMNPFPDYLKKQILGEN